jgi:alpha-ketoglutarate-dependent taurine dioxygenase
VGTSEPGYRYLSWTDPTALSAVVDHMRRGNVVVVRTQDETQCDDVLSATETVFGPCLHRCRTISAGHSLQTQSPPSVNGEDDCCRQTLPLTVSPHALFAASYRPPRLVVLLCTEASNVGGDSTFVSASLMLNALERRFTTAEIAPMWRTDAQTIDVDGQRVFRPVFGFEGGGRSRRVRCYFSSHECQRTSYHPMTLPAFDFCREYVRKVENQLSIRLVPGECAFVPNSMVLTGRTGWSDDPDGVRAMEVAGYAGDAIADLSGFFPSSSQLAAYGDRPQH